MNRRHFLMGTTAVLAGRAVRAFSSPNDTVRVAVVGCGGRGQDHVNGFSRLANVEVVALCDVDEAHFAPKIKSLTDKGKKTPATYVDLRKLLENKDIDAISIASPNHWHTLQTIWACQAGKDVYVEKPSSYNVFESQQIVAAARKYNRMVQQGSQARSSPALREGVQRMRAGELGEIYMARGLCYKWRDSIGRFPDGPMAPGEKFAYTVNSKSYQPTYDAEYLKHVNYDLWLGPAPVRPFNRNRFHYNWHWFWDTGNGDIGNQGIHQLDIARWGLGVTYPTKVSAIGGKVMFDDDQETPNTLTASWEFEVNGKRKMMVFEVRHWISPHEAGIGGDKPGNTIGNHFLGSKGYLIVDGNKYTTFMGENQVPGPTASQPEEHYANFVNAVRSRRREDLNAEIAEGALSCTLMHLANVSYRVGRTIHWDAETMSCVGDAEANKLLTRKYRAPFVVPEKV